MIKPFLGWPEALETRHLGAQVDVLPLRIEAGGLQSVEATEQVIYEAPVSVGIGRTVEASCRPQGCGMAIVAIRSPFGTKLG